MILPALLAAGLVLAAPADLPPAHFYAQTDAGAGLVGLELVVSAGTARENVAQNGLAALAAETLLRTPVDGEPLIDRVAAAGGSIGDVVAPNVVRFSIEALPASLPAIAADIARAVRAPDTSATALAAARATLEARTDEDEANPVLVGLEMLRRSFYAGGAALPAFGTTASLSAFTPADVSAFFAEHYRRGDVFATATGHVDDATSAAVRTLIDAFPAGTEAPPILSVKGFGPETKRVVTHRDIGSPFVLLGFGAPALGDPDFAPMLVLRALFEGIITSSGPTTPRAFERGIDVVYDYDLKPATFTIAINGAQLDPSTGLTVVQTVLKTALTKPLGTKIVKRYKDVAQGEWDLEALTLTDRAWRIGAAISDGACPAAAQNVAAAIDAVTPADIERVAKAYLAHDTVALVLPRSGP